MISTRRRFFDFPQAILLGAALLLASCGTNPATANADQANADTGSLKSTILLGKVGALSKEAAINLAKLIVVATSTATPPDTVRDTTAISGNSALTLLKVYTLKPLRTWTLTATTKDAKDSIIHSGATGSFFIKPGDTTEVSLNLTSRFTMYEAHFNSLPDSISSTVTGTGKDVVKIKRVVLKVDGTIRGDSSSATYFTAGQTVNVYFDYITPGAHTALLEAYGDQNKYSGILYSGTSSINVTAGVDDTKSITLSWVGPNTGTGKLSVTMGKVGKVIVNGALPGAVLQ